MIFDGLRLYACPAELFSLFVKNNHILVGQHINQRLSIPTYPVDIIIFPPFQIIGKAKRVYHSPIIGIQIIISKPNQSLSILINGYGRRLRKIFIQINMPEI